MAVITTAATTAVNNKEGLKTKKEPEQSTKVNAWVFPQHA
jgi:hypothetical protein